MTGLYVSAPLATWRRPAATLFWESFTLPPPSVVFGFLLSLVGEEDRNRHKAAKIGIVRLDTPDLSRVLRTVWRHKNRGDAYGEGMNKTVDYQEILTGIRLLIWVDSGLEFNTPETLESRVNRALFSPHTISRYGALRLGGSSDLVDEVSVFDERKHRRASDRPIGFFQSEDGNETLPVEICHRGPGLSRYVQGRIQPCSLSWTHAQMVSMR